MGKNIYHGYIVFASTFVLSIVSIGVFNACSLFLDPLTDTFANDSLALTLMPFWITIQVVVGLAASMGGGPLQDWLSEVAGLQMPYQFVLFGGGLICFGFILSSFATSIWILLLGSILLGIGIGFNGFISAAICVLWFDKNRGMMLLLALSGRGLGSMLSSLVIAKLLAAYDNDSNNSVDGGIGDGEDDPWRPVMRIVGIACLIIGSIASIGMRLPTPGEVEAHETGEALADLDYDDDEEEDPAEKDSLLKHDDENVKVTTPTSSPKPTPVKSPAKSPTGSYGTLTPSSPALPSAPSVATRKAGRARPSGAALRPSTAYTNGPRSSVAVISQMRNTRQSSVAMGGVGGKKSISFAPTRPSRASRISSVLAMKRNLRKSSVAEFNALSFAPVHFSLDDDEDLDDYFKDESVDAGTGGEGQLTFTQVLLSRTSICLNIWSLISSFAFLNLQVYLPAYATSDLGLPSSVAGTAMTAFGLGLLLANLTLGPITDWLGANPMLFWSMMGLALMDFLWPLCTDAMSIEAVAGVYGFFSATNGCLPLIIVADAFNNVPPNYILMLNGVLNVTKCPGFLFGPTISAIFQSNPDDYASIAAVSWIVLVVGNAFLLGIPSPDEDSDDDGDDDDGTSEEKDRLHELRPSTLVGAGGLDTIMDVSGRDDSNRESYQSNQSNVSFA